MVLFYICSLAVIMMVILGIRSDPPPFTMFSRTGLGMVASLVNLVVLTSAASSANSGITPPRGCSLPLASRRCSSSSVDSLCRHVPQNALFLSCVFFALAILLAFGDSILSVFTVVMATSATLSWSCGFWLLSPTCSTCASIPDKHRTPLLSCPVVSSAWLFIIFIALTVVVPALESGEFEGLLMSAAWMVIITVVGVASSSCS